MAEVVILDEAVVSSKASLQECLQLGCDIIVSTEGFGCEGSSPKKKLLTIGNPPLLELRHGERMLEHDEGCMDKLFIGQVVSREGPRAHRLRDLILAVRIDVVRLASSWVSL